MLPFQLDDGALGSQPTILAVGAHADDIEIGGGGTLLRLAEAYPQADVHWVVLSASDDRESEARASAAEFLQGFTSSRIVIGQFRDSYFPYVGGEVKEFFETLKAELSPDLIFTHQRNDLHQDHRLVCELTWNTFRDHLIFEYEIPKYDGDLGSPNVFVGLSEEQAKRKVEVILEHFTTQHERRWFGADLFFATLRIRGMESNAPSSYSEAFMCRKVVLKV
jgi:LmbE family N-acetylglucosaminyl deacetylase